MSWNISKTYANIQEHSQGQERAFPQNTENRTPERPVPVQKPDYNDPLDNLFENESGKGKKLPSSSSLLNIANALGEINDEARPETSQEVSQNLEDPNCSPVQSLHDELMECSSDAKSQMYGFDYWLFRDDGLPVETVESNSSVMNENPTPTLIDLDQSVPQRNISSNPEDSGSNMDTFESSSSNMTEDEDSPGTAFSEIETQRKKTVRAIRRDNFCCCPEKKARANLKQYSDCKAETIFELLSSYSGENLSVPLIGEIWPRTLTDKIRAKHYQNKMEYALNNSRVLQKAFPKLKATTEDPRRKMTTSYHTFENCKGVKETISFPPSD